MNKLKQNPFWLGIAVAAVVLVIGAVVLVGKPFAEKSGLQRQVVNKAKDLKKKRSVPGNEDIRSQEEAREKMIKAYKDIGLFYAQSNDHLERWFTELRLNADQAPNRGNFMSIYRGEKDKIETSLKEKGVKLGIGDEAAKHTFGFNWEDPQPADFDKTGADEPKVLKEIQKRFWARERVAKAILTILAEGGKVTRVHDFRFFKKLHPQIAGAWDGYPGNQDAVHYMGVGSLQPYQAPPNFQEYDLPQKLGRTLTFGFAVELPYSQVPRVISEILNPAAEKNVAARLLVNVTGTHVSIREQNQPEETVTFAKGDMAARQAAIQKIQDGLKPVDVMLTVTCQIIDFEPTELKKFEAPAQE